MKRVLLVSSILAAVGTFSASRAADLKAPAPVLRYAPAPSWTGFYIGGQIGGTSVSTGASGFDTAGFDNHSPNSPWGLLSFPTTQTSVGVFGGYDYQIGRAVVGLEADYNRSFGSNYSHIHENEYPGEGGTWSVRSDWTASIRGRLGYLVT